MIPPELYEDLETFLWLNGTTVYAFLKWREEKDSGVYEEWANEDLH